jgi:hypothetical protein
MNYNIIAEVYMGMLEEQEYKQIMAEEIVLTAEDFSVWEELSESSVSTNQKAPPKKYSDHVHNVANHMTNSQEDEMDSDDRKNFRNARDGLKRASAKRGISYKRALHVARAISNSHLDGGYEKVGRSQGK